MASSAAAPPSTLPWRRQIAWRHRGAWIERWLEAERDQLPLWLPVLLGTGIAAWFVLPDRRAWIAALLIFAAIAFAGAALARGSRAAQVVMLAGVAAFAGLALAWWRAERVAAPVLARPVIVAVSGRVEVVEPLAARDLVRVTVATTAGLGLPPRVRVNLPRADTPAGVVPGATIRVGARMMPPAPPALPGGYDFARSAWFAELGATGRGYAPVAVNGGDDAARGLRDRLTAWITSRLPGSEGGIAAALATGDEGAIGEQDQDAMRRAGLTHLLSVSGLHITAAVAATMFVVLRLLALSPWLALHTRLPLIAAVAGAGTAIGYTLLTGSQVPTVRSCVAALLVLAALALGRESMTLRLVAAGALAVLLLWPEALAGPSFQLSFAAITAIVTVHEHPRVQRWFGPHEEGRAARLLRGAASLLVTGLVVEGALMPISAYHFHKAGIYGAAANIVAIPLTTFVIMPLEALALALDGMGVGAPAWWLSGQALALLLWLARTVASAPGAVAALPTMPGGAFALMVGGGLWIALWRTRWRRLGAVPLAVGAAWALATPPPDLLVTGDGRHLAIRTQDGALAMLRDKAGDYTRDMLAENGGVDGEPLLLAEQRDARCSRDLCLAEVERGGRRWRVLATRSQYMVPIADLVAACRDADVVVSERRLPRTCRPRWLKLDASTLRRTGGVAIAFAAGTIAIVRSPGDHHPWQDPPTVQPVKRSGAESRTASPGSAPAQAHSAADRRRGWRDRAGSSPPRAGNI